MGSLFTWAVCPKHQPRVGDVREITRLILLPKKLCNEWRWLGRERIVQHFREWTEMDPEGYPLQGSGWVDVRWAA